MDNNSRKLGFNIDGDIVNEAYYNMGMNLYNSYIVCGLFELRLAVSAFKKIQRNSKLYYKSGEKLLKVKDILYQKTRDISGESLEQIKPNFKIYNRLYLHKIVDTKIHELLG